MLKPFSTQSFLLAYISKTTCELQVALYILSLLFKLADKLLFFGLQGPNGAST